MRRSVLLALSLACLSAFAAWVREGVRSGYVDTAAVPAAGVFDFGTATDILVCGQASCYLAAPSGEWTLAVDAAQPRYPFQIRVLSSNGLTYGSSLVNDNGWTAGAVTNVLYFFPDASGPTNWLFWGVAR